ncbi:ABC transporter permease [Enterococcus sp. 669A]|uniref:ABC transporter permease n=1 Tax=Candidatus Enterococcus moelleringii TaxID=2815325 RepID=A0ABS3LBA2_9ENTE|nr:ABC transporter permease [Enterococcus sp. 669A]MBO1306902.1 ABC transporter permease [Enterococcus sp. 669A]
MYKKIVKNDIKNNKLISLTITMFVFLAVLLTSLATILAVNLSSAVDNSMIEARTPHLMQMHSGDINEERLAQFADEQEYVEEYQTADFLNIEGSDIAIGENSLMDSVQDNGFSKQSSQFDYLLDLNGEIIQPKEGEIYVPIYYLKEGVAKQGDPVKVHGVSFKVAGFLRDSQMNAAMISSKRFLVHPNDYQKIEPYGRLEHLIEFRLSDAGKSGEVESAYLSEGLESNGPSATSYQLFKLANAINDGMMIALLILVSLLVILVTFLCIRFTLLAKIEEDFKEIGVLKAIGLRTSEIKKIYMAKYGMMAAFASVLGYIGAIVLQNPLMENIRLYFGDSKAPVFALFAGLLGALVIFGIVVLYTNNILRRFKKISPAQAIRFGAPEEKTKTTKKFLSLSRNRLFSTNILLGFKDIIARKKMYLTMLFVLIISIFLMIVPQNVHNTISSKNFMTYMGIGRCDTRFDIQQTENISEKAATVAQALSEDESVAKFTVLTSRMFDAKLNDQATRRLKVELGDHSQFPIAYSKGHEPRTASEIALSKLSADDLEKEVDDTVELSVDGKKRLFTVSGIYSDITNGGKTAKANFTVDSEASPVLWSTIPVAFTKASLTNEKTAQFQKDYSFAKVADISAYTSQTFGSTIAGIKKASYAAIAATILLVLLVTILFMKMLVTKDRYTIAALKSLGFVNRSIRYQYIARSGVVLIIGVLIGTILANTLGELVGVALISVFGVSSFHFEINPLFAYIFAPAVVAICVFGATLIGTLDIPSIKIADHIKE